MARDNKVFQVSLKRGSAYAWNEQWTEAADQYRCALAEFPDDVSARTYLAMALYKSRQFEESLALYLALWKAQPSNLTLLQRVAELQEAVGDRESAAISYSHLAEAHGRRRAPKDAVRAWLKVAQLSPPNPVIWGPILEAATQAGMVRHIVPAYLDLARELALQSRFQDAIKIAENAEKLDPGNPLTVMMLSGIQRGLQYWWRAAGLGEEVFPEDLARVIPTVSSIQAKVQVEGMVPPEAAIGEAVAPPATPADEAGPSGDEKPAITVYAENVTLSLDQSGLMSIQGDVVKRPRDDEPPYPLPELEEAAALEEEPVEPEPQAIEPEQVEEQVAPEEPAEQPAEAETPAEPASVGEPVEAMGEAEPPDIQQAQPVDFAVPDRAEDEVEAEEAGDETPAETAGGVEEETATPEEELVAPEDEPGEIGAEEAEEAVAGQAIEEAASEEPAVTDEQVEMEAVEPAEVEEEEAPLTWEELVKQAQDVKTSGRLREAMALFQRSLEGSAAIAEKFAELGEAQEQSDQLENAAVAYAQALELAPELPRAHLGMARVQLAQHSLDRSEASARQALEGLAAGSSDAAGQAVDLLLEVQQERVAYGDLGAAVAGLAWLRSVVPVHSLPIEAVEKVASAPEALLGSFAAEHLDEIEPLPAEARLEIVTGLKVSEQELAAGNLRLAADEMYRLVSTYPNFLPAQAVIGRILAGQGRIKEARDRARRLLDLYELRGEGHRVMDILRWMVAGGFAGAEDRERLADMLESQGQAEEAAAVRGGQLEPQAEPSLEPSLSLGEEAERGSPVEARVALVEESTTEAGQVGQDGRETKPTAPPEREWEPYPLAEEVAAEEPLVTTQEVRWWEAEAIEQPAEEVREVEERRPRLKGMFNALRAMLQKEGISAAEQYQPQPEGLARTDIAAREAMLRLAESKYASGDVKGTANLVLAALGDERIADAASKAALLRVLQVLEPTAERREALLEFLDELGLPENLADL